MGALRHWMLARSSLSVQPVFFGWYVVAASAVGLIFGLSTFLGISFGFFLKPLSETFGWSRAEVSFGLTISTLIIIGLAPVAGRMIDKYGVKRLLMTSIVAFGLTVCAMSLLTASIYHFYAMFALVAVLGLITLPTSYTRVILNWFDAKRGIALGVALSGVGIGAVVMPPMLQFLISTWGWRVAYVGVGLAALLISLPVIQMLLRERPEDMGLLPDGGHQAQHLSTGANPEPPGLSLGEAARQRAFWLLVVVFFLMGIATIGTTVHLMALLTDRGLSPASAATTISVLGLSMIFGRVVGGLLLDRFFAPFVAFVFLIGTAAGLLILAGGAPGQWVLLAIVLLGLGFGAEFDLMSYLVSRYLGLRAYGQIYGFIYAAFAIGAGIGPVVMGRFYDLTNSYTTGLNTFTGIGVTAAVLILFLGPYRIFSQFPDETPQETVGQM